MFPSLQAIKLGAFAFSAIALLACGFYGGYRWELPAVQKAQLALSNQITQDSLATAKADENATANLIADTKLDGTTLAAHQGRVSAVQNVLGNVVAQIPVQAAQTGQDGPVAPVLTNALIAIASAQGTPK